MSTVTEYQKIFELDLRMNNIQFKCYTRTTDNKWVKPIYEIKADQKMIDYLGIKYELELAELYSIGIVYIFKKGMDLNTQSLLLQPSGYLCTCRLKNKDCMVLQLWECSFCENLDYIKCNICSDCYPDHEHAEKRSTTCYECSLCDPEDDFTNYCGYCGSEYCAGDCFL